MQHCTTIIWNYCLQFSRKETQFCASAEKYNLSVRAVDFVAIRHNEHDPHLAFPWLKVNFPRSMHRVWECGCQHILSIEKKCDRFTVANYGRLWIKNTGLTLVYYNWVFETASSICLVCITLRTDICWRSIQNPWCATHINEIPIYSWERIGFLI